MQSFKKKSKFQCSVGFNQEDILQDYNYIVSETSKEGINTWMDRLPELNPGIDCIE